MADLNASRLAPLHPRLKKLGVELIAKCKAQGIDILITQGLRTVEEQDALFAQGRLGLAQVNGLRKKASMAPIGPKENTKVTNARGGQSFHNFGLAIDFVPLLSMGKANWNTKDPSWMKVRQIGKALGLRPASEVKPDWDLPHLQLVIGGKPDGSLVKAYAAGGLNAVYKIVQ